MTKTNIETIKNTRRHWRETVQSKIAPEVTNEIKISTEQTVEERAEH